MKQFIAGTNDVGLRIDKFIQKVCMQLPSSLLYKYIRLKRIKINGKRVQSDTRIALDDCIEMYINDEFFEQIDAEQAFLKVSGNIDILYEDDNILLIHKKQGMLVHEGEVEKQNTLIAHIQRYLFDKGQYRPDAENTFVPALCNRLDRNTGGIVIAAKNAPSLRVLNQKIKDREIEKKYLCIVKGQLKQKAGEFKGYILKDSSKKQVSVLSEPQPGALSAVTRYRVLKEMPHASLVEVGLITGRTHQIRAHFASAGHPLAGDGKYGDYQFNREMGMSYQALYAYKVTFHFSSSAEHLDYLKGKTFAVDVGLIEWMKLLSE